MAGLALPVRIFSSSDSRWVMASSISILASSRCSLSSSLMILGFLGGVNIGCCGKMLVSGSACLVVEFMIVY